MGEIIENIRTFVLPNELNLYTFKTSFVYDSWNRLLQMTYPDGEILNYTYNTGGNLKSMESQYNNTQPYYYITNIKYNKFEQKTDIVYGNGSESHYTYDNIQRLSTLVTQSINGTLQDIVYNYDNANNIDRIVNVSSVLSNDLGGYYTMNFTYDSLSRLISSNGFIRKRNYMANYNQSMSFTKDSKILNKQVTAEQIFGNTLSYINKRTLYNFNQSQPHSISNIFDMVSNSTSYFITDPNGNMINQDERSLCWDDINRLLGVTDRSYTSYYSYDHKGDRHYKLTGLNSYMNINGIQNKYTTLSKPTLYVEGFVVATPQGYTKHYYNGSERVASSIGLGGISTINTQLSLSTSWTTKKEESNAMMTRLFGNCLFVNLSSNTKPITMNLYRYQNILTGTISKYFYHTNHLGSSSWITDGSGNAIQHLQNLPFGEDWIDERSTTWNSRYTFTGKEKDTETGYHYFGARYYDSGLSIWLSVDPMSDKYPSMSPYNYCANNPVILVDPDGKEFNPIFGLDGEFLGTDNKGLQGEAIIMQKEYFKQNMDHEKALELGTLRSSHQLKQPFKDFGDMYSKIDNFMATLPDRPDYDGVVTLEDANKWYREGNGQPLFADLSKLNLNILRADIQKGEKKAINVLTYGSSIENFLVYGTITIKRTGDLTVKAYSDKYDFNIQNQWNPLNWVRNIETRIGKRIAGSGVPFYIHLTGEQQMNPVVY